MPKCRGTFYGSLKAFLNKNFDADTWRQILDTLSPEDQAEVKRAVATAWTDLDVKLRVTKAFVDFFKNKWVGQRSLSGNTQVKNPIRLLEELAIHEAEKDLTGVQRLFLRLANPAYTLEKAGQYWNRFYDWGELVVDRKAKNLVLVSIKKSPVADELFCIHFRAYITRMFEMVGAKDVKVRHLDCRARGGTDCVFEASWL
jgi:hypothetical protein